jgi:integrase
MRPDLTPAEIDRLIAAAQRLGRYGQRDATMILLAYRHGLRVSELVGLRREQVDLRQGLLHVRRRKNGLPNPLRGPELRALREVLREYPDSAYVFISERGAPMTAATFRKLVARAGDAAKLGMPIHPHMLRHSTGFKLAKRRPGHPRHPALPRSQEHPAHGPLHPACHGSLQRLLERLKQSLGRPRIRE